MAFRTLKDINVKHKKVLVRVDFNAPLDEKGRISDDTRIRAAIPTIEYLLKKEAVVILMTHLGRPEGVDEKLRTDVLARHLQKLIKQPVYKYDDVLGAEVEEFVNELVYGEICLLENLRFYKEEEANDDNFAMSLSELADVYVNDAFGVSHRAHASVHAITKFLPSAAGFQLQKEIEMLDKALHAPKHPFIAIMGGAKVSDKIEVIENLLKKVDALLIGGAMAFTFLKATGVSVGKSKCEPGKVALAKKLLKKARGKLVLPIDVVVAKTPQSSAKAVSVNKIPADEMGLDIGPETVQIYEQMLSNAKTVVWNGPVGLFEVPKFAKGTFELAKCISKLNATTIVGGGDSIDAINKLKLANKFTHLSTGGGASLDFLAGKTLPGIKALEENYVKRR